VPQRQKVAQQAEGGGSAYRRPPHQHRPLVQSRSRNPQALAQSSPHVRTFHRSLGRQVRSNRVERSGGSTCDGYRLRLNGGSASVTRTGCDDSGGDGSRHVSQDVCGFTGVWARSRLCRRVVSRLEGNDLS
jgi:hypothetical protein